MGGFSRGVSSIGDLYPDISKQIPQTSYLSAWGDVGNSFAQAGNSIRKALKECEDAGR